MAEALTCIVKKHSVRLGPDLPPHHVVFNPGCDVEGGCGVKEPSTGYDFILADGKRGKSEKEKK